MATTEAKLLKFKPTNARRSATIAYIAEELPGLFWLLILLLILYVAYDWEWPVKLIERVVDFVAMRHRPK